VDGAGVTAEEQGSRADAVEDVESDFSCEGLFSFVLSDEAPAGRGELFRRPRSAVRTYLVRVYAVVHERPADTAGVERETDGPVDGSRDRRPAEQAAPVERETLR
jgi:hypothetical protein